jgi:hypothetical protein
VDIKAALREKRRAGREAVLMGKEMVRSGIEGGIFGIIKEKKRQDRMER